MIATSGGMPRAIRLPMTVVATLQRRSRDQSAMFLVIPKAVIGLTRVSALPLLVGGIEIASSGDKPARSRRIKAVRLT